MNRLENATQVYWSAMSRFREGVAGPREYEDVDLLTQSEDVKDHRLWGHAFDLRMSMQCFGVDELTEIPEAARG